ncbi:MAG: 16S rRNA G966 N2-methylase RsmD [Saprospiraceae bacterium]|jgi:16S rRNA G966 N2-methylase RsmD
MDLTKIPTVNESMMDDCLAQEVLAFIDANIKTDPYKLLLQKSPFEHVSMKYLVQQIQGKKVAFSKFPFLLEYKNFIYPPKVSLEQASSERLARFKADLIEGESFADLTGGMGIDSYLLGCKFQECQYVEPNKELFQSTTSNFNILGYDQCVAANHTAEDFLKFNKTQFDWIYIDPSRRVEGNRKTSIANYEPNIVDLKDQLLATSKKVLIKLSPMQDISECISVLEHVEKVWVISIKNDVKELLLQLGEQLNNNPEIIAVDIDNQTLDYTNRYFDRITNIECSVTQKYIYQPASALVKSELHNRYSEVKRLKKLHPNTQLFTSNSLVDNYFGRVFKVKAFISSNKKELKKLLPMMKANVICKNYPLSPQELISKLKIKAGGEDYLLAFTDVTGKKILTVCNRLK